MLDDAGQEKWDKDLHDQLRSEEIVSSEGTNCFMELTVRDVNTIHAQLLDAKKVYEIAYFYYINTRVF